MVVDGEDTRPPPPSWLDKDFVEKALRSADGNPTLTVSSFEVSMANAVGDGYNSDMFRITARLQDSQERRVIVKCHPEGEGMRVDVVKQGGIFDIETQMLVETLPKMYSLLNKARPGKYQPFAAKCLYHGNDPVQFIVLEDLRHSGFTLAKRQQGMDLEHCSLVIQSLAWFHASSIAVYDQYPAAIESYDKSLFCQDLREHMATFFEKGMKQLSEESLNWPGFEKYSSKFKNLECKIYDRIVETNKKRDDEINVLLHGDIWTNNIMFKYSGSALEDMRFVDFQLSHYASPGLDLNNLLYACPTDEVRIHHLSNLIEEYHKTFVETLDILGCSSRTVPLSVIKKAFEDHAVFGFVSATTVLPIVLSKPEDGFELESSQSDEGVETYHKMYSNPLFVKAIKRMLPLFEEKGLLDD